MNESWVVIVNPTANYALRELWMKLYKGRYLPPFKAVNSLATAIHSSYTISFICFIPIILLHFFPNLLVRPWQKEVSRLVWHTKGSCTLQLPCLEYKQHEMCFKNYTDLSGRDACYHTCIPKTPEKPTVPAPSHVRIEVVYQPSSSASCAHLDGLPLTRFFDESLFSGENENSEWTWFRKRATQSFLTPSQITSIYMLMHTSSLSSEYPDDMQTRIWLGKGKDPIQANHARRITVYNEENETLFTLPCAPVRLVVNQLIPSQ